MSLRQSHDQRAVRVDEWTRCDNQATTRLSRKRCGAGGWSISAVRPGADLTPAAIELGIACSRPDRLYDELLCGFCHTADFFLRRHIGEEILLFRCR
jgi:hypothetical protein